MSLAGTAPRKLMAASAIVGCLGLSASPITSAPASPCTLALLLVCQLVPSAPDLDEDIDLTKQQPQNPLQATNPDTTPPGG
jgi:hypothetical protein